MSGRGAWQLSPVELAQGLPTGFVPGGAVPAGAAGELTAREAFDEVLRGCVTASPCVVAFSGGRDSSAILAAAAALARQEGLPAPVAMTQRFADVPSSDESAWQEHVVDVVRSEVGPVAWEVVEVRGELDLVGPLARAAAERHGVLWPPNSHFIALMAERAAGGVLLTGLGGDEVMSPGWVWDRVNWVLDGHVRPRGRDLLSVAASRLGPVARAARTAYHPDSTSTCRWLTERGERRLAEIRRTMGRAEPVRHDDALREHFGACRYRSISSESLGRVGAGYGARVVSPFAEDLFLAALARERGRSAPLSRTQAMASLFSDVLTPQVLSRVGKATFNGAFWGSESRRFAALWTADPRVPDERLAASGLLDPAGLAEEWRRPAPDARSYMLLQHFRSLIDD